MKNFFSFFISIIFFIVLICFIGIISFYSSNNYLESESQNNNYFFSNSDYFWPTPGYHTITSYFGKRVSPVTGASSNHSGIDIGASEGASIFSILTGKVIFTGFYGANGHTIIIESNNINVQYSHLSPNYLVTVR